MLVIPSSHCTLKNLMFINKYSSSSIELDLNKNGVEKVNSLRTLYFADSLEFFTCQQQLYQKQTYTIQTSTVGFVFNNMKKKNKRKRDATFSKMIFKTFVLVKILLQFA